MIAKESANRLKAQGIEKLRENIAELTPFLADRVGELESFDNVKLLTVAVDRLVKWHRPGLLCIGDAAHAMSPVGGVGINLAIQESIATANILGEALSGNEAVNDELLARVQARREWPVKLTSLHPKTSDFARPRQHRQNQAALVRAVVHSCPVFAADSRRDRRHRRAAGEGQIAGAGKGGCRPSARLITNMRYAAYV
ncbi:MAG: hypothetical protein USCAAHI_00247 [Beijerinckiaceae bacterium]|nr:MAG: hypothetical protein USCAAHI_00247 [Beijerinckiaceae bacterium]